MSDDIENLGPFAPYAGVWEGDKGKDESPDDDRISIEHNAFRERVVLEPIGLVENHEQSLYGLRYAKTAWRLGADVSFHEEVGYWLWDAERKEAMITFIVPRGVTVLAGGTAEPDSSHIKLRAEVGSQVFGICSAPFLDREFQTVAFDMELTLRDEKTFSYHQNTQLQIKGQPAIFNHTDQNTLTKLGT